MYPLKLSVDNLVSSASSYSSRHSHSTYRNANSGTLTPVEKWSYDEESKPKTSLKNNKSPRLTKSSSGRILYPRSSAKTLFFRNSSKIEVKSLEVSPAESQKKFVEKEIDTDDEIKIEDEVEKNTESTTSQNKKLTKIELYIKKRMSEIIEKYRRRTEYIKNLLLLPPSPSITDSAKESREAPKPPALKIAVGALAALKGLGQFTPDVSKTHQNKSLYRKILDIIHGFRIPQTFDPSSRYSVSWLSIMCFCFIYNAWFVPMRSVFSEYQTDENLPLWMAADYFCDAIYIMDIAIKSRTQTLEDGTWITDSWEIKKSYFRSWTFMWDSLSLLPLDLLYMVYGPISAFRFPRLFKVAIFFEFFDRMDRVLANPTFVRLMKAFFLIVYTIHVNAMVYYGFSLYEGIGSNSWVYDGQGIAYIRCYFFGIKTATSIGKNPKPVNSQERVLMTVAWLVGVFLFAILVGQVKDIVSNATKQLDDFRKTKDDTIDYLRRYNVPEETIDKVRLWFSYTWKTQKTLDEVQCLKELPTKLQMDLAINVHIQTLSKVELFKDCEENLLRALLLKLRPMIYLPGDYVCRKGEIGREMYIVKNGSVEVVDEAKILATLLEGSVFGEISLLSLGGDNRRTADVKSVGYSNLFLLTKADVEATIKDYPEAKRILESKAYKIIKSKKPKTPKVSSAENRKKKNPKLFTALMELTNSRNSASSWSWSRKSAASEKENEHQETPQKYAVETSEKYAVETPKKYDAETSSNHFECIQIKAEINSFDDTSSQNIDEWRTSDEDDILVLNARGGDRLFEGIHSCTSSPLLLLPNESFRNSFESAFNHLDENRENEKENKAHFSKNREAEEENVENNQENDNRIEEMQTTKIDNDHESAGEEYIEKNPTNITEMKIVSEIPLERTPGDGKSDNDDDFYDAEAFEEWMETQEFHKSFIEKENENLSAPVNEQMNFSYETHEEIFALDRVKVVSPLSNEVLDENFQDCDSSESGITGRMFLAKTPFPSFSTSEEDDQH